MGPQRRNSMLVLSALVALALAATTFAASEPPGRRVLVGFRADTGPKTPQARAEAVRQAGGLVHRSFDLVPAVAGTLPEGAIKALKARHEVEYVEDDVVLYAIGQVIPWGVNRIDADLAWPTGNTGKGVKVAILDTGIDYDHPDLLVAGGVNYAGSNNDGSTSPLAWDDGHGHGTHVAGIVAARNNTIGVIGVAPGVSLWAVKVLGNDGSGYTSDIIQGLDWCVAHGMRVASMSLGGGSTASLKYACDRAYSMGVLLVAAAGNNGGAVIYPAAYSSVMAVAATDSLSKRAYFSNYGPQIELAAPGVSIYSAYKDGTYATMSGTSMACPHVTGAAALAYASGLTTNAAVRKRLTSTAEDLGTKGYDIYYGYGLVDAQKAAMSTATASIATVDAGAASAVSVQSITYSAQGGPGNPDLLVSLHVVDNLENPVSNVSVLAGVFVDGRLRWTLSGATGSDGSVSLRIGKARPGLYTATVAKVTADGLTWDGATPPNEFSNSR
jgi:subtilisin